MTLRSAGATRRDGSGRAEAPGARRWNRDPLLLRLPGGDVLCELRGEMSKFPTIGARWFRSWR